MDRYEMYRNAGAAVERSWIQGELKDSGGGVCIVGSLLPQLDLGAELPKSVRREVARRLWRYPSYWASYLVALMVVPATKLARLCGSGLKIGLSYSSQQAAIELWNDLAGRKKETVVKVLGSLASKHERKHLRNERDRLQAVIDKLEAEKTVLLERIVRLESKNATLIQKLLPADTIDADRRTLAELDSQLDNAAARLAIVS